MNPVLVRGQVHGGLGQGIAQALYEGVELDEWGTPVTTSLATYGMPAATELPAFETSHADADDREPARGEGDRRVRDDRLHSGGRERRLP